MRIAACICDRCGAMHPYSHFQRTAHVHTGNDDIAFRAIDHSDLELCPTCAVTFNDLLKKFLENQ